MVDWGLAGAVIITGLVLVFVILLLLILVVELTSKLVNSTGKDAGAPAAKTVPVTAAPKAPAVLPKAPEIGAGIEEETVAAIMAAVSCMTDATSGTQYAVKSINRVANARPVWGFAGMQQNTRPF